MDTRVCSEMLGDISAGNKKILLYILMARGLFSFQQWSIITILARTNDLGALRLFGLAIAIVTPINAVFNMGLRAGVATDIDQRFSQSEYWITRIGTLGASVILIPLIAIILWDTPDLLPMLWVILFVKTVDLFAELFYGFYQRHDRLVEFSTSQILRALLGTGAFALVYFTLANTVLSVTAWGVSWVAVLILYNRAVLKKIGEAVSFSALWKTARERRTLKTCGVLLMVQFPIGVAAGIGNIGLVTPRLAFEQVATLEDFGVFTALIVVFQAKKHHR